MELPQPSKRSGLQRTHEGQNRKKRVQFGYRLQPRGISNMVSRKQFRTLVWPAALAVVASVFMATPGTEASGTVTAPRKFYNDDPLLREPAPRAVQKVATRQVDDIYDFLA